ncbi:hypothetical protein O181_059254 [Austropuccinia psidii MF-1]|uniref:DDE Tnp4 domain-containing protein n=1 Tax=Austropuccinia psidii MF-1 TaxID=1389203 RepID=A0A9Q3EDX8_9BASI|nr:hypothetical protein [Austropuccinia psidii MF-1]
MFPHRPFHDNSKIIDFINFSSYILMPKQSDRVNFIRELVKTKFKLCEETLDAWMDILVAPGLPTIGSILAGDLALMAMMIEWVMSSEDDVQDILQRVICSRYLTSRQSLASRKEFGLATLLGMNPNDFKQVVCTSQEGFVYIYDLIKDNPVFHNNSYCMQLDLCQQLALALNLWQPWKWGLCWPSCKWPDEAKCQAISSFMTSEGFPGKSHYSLNVQIVCDHHKRIIALLSGWPASCADGGMYRKMGLYRHPNKFFSPGKYILTDSAYPLGINCIPCYKGAAANNYCNDNSTTT